ncbi:hypothetical protein [Aureispira anguillae]|uniref:DinB-like domain-containing protein n=1 Tax=Aureispira anguillae TaxID=2864201 RepID=A0A916DSD8_9BACT|nr:hypothetical protein [Aureispira anguillae]BDS11125.1 hypothetical protein AsAng_0018360 [Aureispira anguillae]
MNLTAIINELETWIPKRELFNKEVTNSSIGWQISHSLKVINGVAKLLPKSNPADYKWQFNFARILILTTGNIPRGRAKAPKIVQPKEDEMTEDNLQELFAETKKNLAIALKTPPKAHFDHPYFGLLKRDKAFRFLAIHTRHHLKIIEDVAKRMN